MRLPLNDIRRLWAAFTALLLLLLLLFADLALHALPRRQLLQLPKPIRRRFDTPPERVFDLLRREARDHLDVPRRVLALGPVAAQLALPFPLSHLAPPTG